MVCKAANGMGGIELEQGCIQSGSGELRMINRERTFAREWEVGEMLSVRDCFCLRVLVRMKMPPHSAA